MTTEKEQLRQEWVSKLKSAIQQDTWGQLIEAQEEYTKLAGSIGAKHGEQYLTSSEKDVMTRLVLCLSARVEAIRDMTDTITAQDVSKLEPIIDDLFPSGGNLMHFPIPSYKFQSATPILPHFAGQIIDQEENRPTEFQTTHNALTNVNGTVVALLIDKIGLKDAETYIDPFMTVLVVDSRNNIIDEQQTPLEVAEKRQQHVHFRGCRIYLKVSLEEMYRCGAALFFEFKHYKPKKKKVSTRCWCFMELNELKRDEESVLEIYHKPTDLKKKKLNLHSVKELYFHVVPSFMS